MAIAKQVQGRAQLNVAGNAWNTLLHWTVGYGYRTWQAIVWLAALLVLGSFIFNAYHPSELTPAKPAREQPGFQPIIRTPTFGWSSWSSGTSWASSSALVKRRRWRPADRLLLAGLGQRLPRPTWSCFLVSPQTLLRWHRVLVRRKWSLFARRVASSPD